jgi:hypothetical protein
MFEPEDLIRMYFTETLSEAARIEFEALQSSGRITADDLAEWMAIADATKLYAQRIAISLPPLPDLPLTPVHYTRQTAYQESEMINSFDKTHPHPYSRSRTRQSITWLFSFTLMFILMGLFLVLLIQPHTPTSTLATLDQALSTEVPIPAHLVAYDVIGNEADLSVFRQIVDASPEYLALMQSTTPQIIIAPTNGNIPDWEALMGTQAGHAWLEGLIQYGESLRLVPHAELSLSRIVGLESGGAVIIVNEDVSTLNNAVVHVIQEGETLFSIATRYNVSMDDLMALNSQLDQEQPLTVGNIIIIKTNILVSN